MRRLQLLMAVVALTLCAGCFGPSSFKSSNSSGQGYVEMTVAWDSMNASAPVRPMALAKDVAMVGVRVVIPSLNAAVSQATTREVAEVQGIITIPVPATADASLFAVAIDQAGQPVMLGYLRGLSISQNAILKLRSDDLEWITPDAYLTGDFSWKTPDLTQVEKLSASALVPSKISAPDAISGKGCGTSAECEVTVSLRISDPFGTSTSNPMICVAGLGINAPCYTNSLTVEGDYQHAQLKCRSSDATCSATPYINGALFGLAGTTYLMTGLIEPIEVNWRP